MSKRSFLVLLISLCKIVAMTKSDMTCYMLQAKLEDFRLMNIFLVRPSNKITRHFSKNTRLFINRYSSIKRGVKCLLS